MADSVPAQQQQRRADKQNDMTATSLTAAGMGAFLLWIFGMIDAGKFFVPPPETALFMGSALLPIMHAIGARWVRRINYDQVVGGVNGAAPAEPVADSTGGK